MSVIFQIIAFGFRNFAFLIIDENDYTAFLYYTYHYYISSVTFRYFYSKTAIKLGAKIPILQSLWQHGSSKWTTLTLWTMPSYTLFVMFRYFHSQTGVIPAAKVPILQSCGNIWILQMNKFNFVNNAFLYSFCDVYILPLSDCRHSCCQSSHPAESVAASIPYQQL